MDPKEVEADTHEDFYRFVANAYDKPRFTFHFRTDAPMDVRALLYVPDSRPGEFGSFYYIKFSIKKKVENSFDLFNVFNFKKQNK
jgi:HSP90 family molecular chaperone